MDFNKFLTLFQPDKQFTNRLGAAQRLWDQSTPAKQSAIIAWLETHGKYKGRNPYFFILDFTVRAEKPKPENWNGRTLDPKKQYRTAKWNGKWGTYSLEDVETFGMETAGGKGRS